MAACMTSTLATTSHALGEEGKTSDMAWDEEADFVVLGLGAAGMGAVKTAAIDNEATVIVLEKRDEEHAGGAFATFLGLFGSARDPLVFSTTSDGFIDENFAQRINEAIDVAPAWLKETTGLELHQSDNDFGHSYMSSNGPEVWKSCYAAVKDNQNLTIHFESVADSLVIDESGAVIGVHANVNGSPMSIKARLGVIICTGNYAGDKDLFTQIHQFKIPFAPGCDSQLVGDGVYLAAQAGAIPFTRTSLAFEWFDWAIAKASEDLGEGMILNGVTSGGNPVFNTRVFVNGAGKRFMNEDATFLHSHALLPFMHWSIVPETRAVHYDNLPMWCIYDSKVPSKHKLWIQEEGNINWTYAKARDIYQWSDDNEAEVERGWIYKADTLEELADLMVFHHLNDDTECRVDKEQFINTVNEYNETICATGEDPLGKAAEYLVALDTPPYYAIETVPMVGYTISGLEVDLDMHVLDREGESIKGLYAAGDIAGMHAQAYPFGAGPSFVLGGFAVESALAASA